MPQSDNYLNIGTVLGGRYRVESPLASGGFGKTYLVKHLNLGKQYALKEFYIKDACLRGDDDKRVTVAVAENHKLFDSQKAKFLKEAKVLSELSEKQDSHIIRVTDLFEENGTAYYVMDYVVGESLNDRIERQNAPMAEDEVLNILRQMLSALHTVHAAGLLHMDIKPANIMVDGKEVCTLIDFGASKQYSLEERHTLSSLVPYTPRFAPLEQQSQNVDKWGPWTDFYALGATLYNLLTGKLPPKSDELTDDFDAALSMPGVSDKTTRLVKWMMSLSTAKRPQSVEEISGFLENSNNSNKTDKQEELVATAEETVIDFPKKDVSNNIQNKTPNGNAIVSKPQSKDFYWLIGCAILATIVGLIILFSHKDNGNNNVDLSDVETRTITANGVSFDMVQVEGGTFQMGSEDGEDDEKPVHEVWLDSYMIGQTEVTQELWLAVMGSNPSFFKGPDHPVEQISWNDIVNDFLPKLNKLTGKNFRLPTEAEWEYAARGGSKSRGYKYSGSNDIDEVAWYDDNSNGTTHPVKSKAPNELGIYDMSGNVWEWCQDWYASDYYLSSVTKNPKGPTSDSSGSFRVNRGGSWFNSASDCRTAYRNYNTPSSSFNDLGLRLAL